ncbi:hypothetical protein HY212_00100 [Candidatus Pacearchaeota archaeon]|nr:hypothetical protein [Candidatus Pacearchaeota archaeon]
MTKKELKEFQKRLEFLTTNEKGDTLNQESLVKYADTVCGFSEELDRAIEDFIGVKPGLCDHEFAEKWDSRATIGEFKEWLNKKLNKGKKE